MRFRNRVAAGRRLADRLTPFADEKPVVLGLPRGGVPVAVEIARALTARLDIVVVRKVGAPRRAELAVGAVGEDGVTVRNLEVLHQLGLSWEDLADRVERERAEVRRRAAALRPGRERLDVNGQTVIVVDDGIATGSTVVAALRIVRGLGARRTVLAVPVAPPDVLPLMPADEVVCLHTPARFRAVGQWFRDFRQVTDDEVRAFLESFDPDA